MRTRAGLLILATGSSAMMLLPLAGDAKFESGFH